MRGAVPAAVMPTGEGLQGRERARGAKADRTRRRPRRASPGASSRLCRAPPQRRANARATLPRGSLARERGPWVLLGADRTQQECSRLPLGRRELSATQGDPRRQWVGEAILKAKLPEASPAPLPSRPGRQAHFFLPRVRVPRPPVLLTVQHVSFVCNSKKLGKNLQGSTQGAWLNNL